MEKLPESIESSNFVSLRAIMSGELIQGKIHIQRNSNEDLKYR